MTDQFPSAPMSESISEHTVSTPSSPAREHDAVNTHELPSHTQKRPRLDSGSRAVRSLSACPRESPSNRLSAPPSRPVVTTPSKITLYIREASDDQDENTTTAVLTPASSPIVSELVTESVDAINIEVEDFEEIVDPMDYINTVEVHDDRLVDNFITSMPFHKAGAKPWQTMKQLAMQFDQEEHHPLIIPRILEWLREQDATFANQQHHWQELFLSHKLLWQQLAILMTKLYTTSSLRFPDSSNLETMRSWVYDLVDAHIRLIRRMLKLELMGMHLLAPGLAPNHSPVFGSHLQALNFLLPCVDSHAAILLGAQAKQKAAFGLLTAPGSLKDMLSITALLVGYIHVNGQNINYRFTIAQMLHFINNSMWSTYRCHQTNEQDIASLPEIIPILLQFFQVIDDNLRQNLSSSKDPLPCDFRRELLSLMSNMLTIMMDLDQNLCHTLSDQVVGSSDLQHVPQESYVAVTTMVWKLKLLRECIFKGRMELRVLGTDELSKELLEFFRRHHSGNSPLRSMEVLPLFQAVAQVLVAEKIVDYIVSVKSHPDLVIRSEQILGFLIVTNNLTSEKMDLIWATLLTTQDSRIMSALFGILCATVEKYTNEDEDLYLCSKVLDFPLPAYGHDARQFVQTLLRKLRMLDYSHDSEGHIMELCIRFLCLFSGQNTNYILRSIFEDAVLTLSKVASTASPQTRQNIYKYCGIKLQNNVDQSPYMYAILKVLQSHSDDVDYVTRELDLLNITMDVFSRQTAAWKSLSLQSSRDLDNENLRRRLELVLYLFLRAPLTADHDKSHQFWCHLIGVESIDATARDFAWQILDRSMTQLPTAEQGHAYDFLYENFLPEVRAEHYVVSFMQFAEKVAIHKLEQQSLLIHQKFVNVFALPGIELLWSIVLSAPKSANPGRLSSFLAALFADGTRMEITSSRPLEEIHASVVETCVLTMDSAFSHWRENTTIGLDTKDDGQINVLTADHQLMFCRVVDFLVTMLQLVRDASGVVDPAIVVPEENILETGTSAANVINGNSIEIALELHPLEGTIKSGQYLKIDDLATLMQLYHRLAEVSGYAVFRVIGGGGFLELLDLPSQTIREARIAAKGRLMVKEYAANVMHKTMGSNKLQYPTTLDTKLSQHFDTFYKFMDGTDTLSQSTARLLQVMAPHESMLHLVSDATIDFELVFPPGESYKQLYSLRCLNAMLHEHASSALDNRMTFITHSTRLLERLLVSCKLPDTTIATPAHIVVCREAIPILCRFIKALGFSDSSPFLDPVGFITSLLEILSLLQDSADDVSVVREIYELFLLASTQYPDFWSIFSVVPGLKLLHKSIFLLHPNGNLCAAIAQTIRTSLKCWPSQSHLPLLDCVRFYWAILLPLMDQSVATIQHAEDLLFVLSDLFQLLFVGRGSALQKDEIMTLHQYHKQWSHELLNHHPHEIIGQDGSEKVISGLAVLLRQCSELLNTVSELSNDHLENLANQLWSKFLFPPFAADDSSAVIVSRMPVCDDQSRAHLYALTSVVSLGRNEASMKIENDWVIAVTDSYEEKFLSTIDRVRSIRSSSGFIGLKNLGNTCYMNSLLTQLYMNPAFREFFMNGITPSSDVQMLCATQNLFCTMQSSLEAYANPSDFVNLVKVYGDDIDLAVQMDVEELYGALFSQWESQLGTEALRQQLQSFYGGSLVIQIKSTECNHVSESEQTFLNIQLEVQGKKNLHDSLEAYIAGDHLQGENKWKCEQCGTLRDAEKRSCLKGLPNSLTFHLKRFAYNISTQQRSKINDSFEFPMEIDMAPYTLEGVSAKHQPLTKDRYDLVGILVHKGQAEHGHYVSYIRTRPRQEHHPPSWLLFDDDVVSDFQPRDIPEHCFGGNKNIEHGFVTDSAIMKVSNAYMLFYERSTSLQHESSKYQPDEAGLLRPKMPPAIARRLHESNCRAARRYCLLGNSHQDFLLQLSNYLVQPPQGAVHLSGIDAEAIGHDLANILVRCLWLSIWRVTSKIKDCQQMAGILDNLLMAMELSESSATLIFGQLIKNLEGFRDVLTRTSDPRVRSLMQNFVIKGLRLTRDWERKSINSSITSDTADIAGAVLSNLERIAQTHLHFSSRGWHEFYAMMVEIASMSTAECLALVEKNFVSVCLQQLCMHKNFDSTANRYRQLLQTLEKNAQQYNNLITLLFCLLSHCHIQDHGDVDERDDCPLNQLSLVRQETRLLWLQNSEGLVWINRMFEKWEPAAETETYGFVPARIIEILLTCEGTTSLRPAIWFTIIDGIIEYTDSTSDLFMKAAPLCLRYCTGYKDFRNVMRAVHGLLEEKESRDWACILAFWKDVGAIRHDRVHPPVAGFGSFYKECVQSAKSFAPYLLTSMNELVRRDTLAHLKDLIFKYPVTEDDQLSQPTELELARAENIFELGKACLHHADNMAKSDGFLIKPQWAQLMECLRMCSLFLEALAELGDNAQAMKNPAETNNFQRDLSIVEQVFQALPVDYPAADDFMQSALSDMSYTEDEDDELLTPTVL